MKSGWDKKEVQLVCKEIINFCVTAHMSNSPVSTKLSAVQLHLLRFFSERPVTEDETGDIQRIIAEYYAQKADQRMDELWEQRGYTAQTMDELLNAPLQKPADAPGH